MSNEPENPIYVSMMDNGRVGILQPHRLLFGITDLVQYIMVSATIMYNIFKPWNSGWVSFYTSFQGYIMILATIVTYIFFYLLKHNTWTHYVFNPDEKKIYKYKMRFGKEKYKFLEDYDKVFSLIIESHYFTEMRLNKYSTGPTHKFPAEWRYTAILLFNNGKYLELNQSTKDHSTDETVHEWTHNDVRLLEDELSCLSDIVKIPYHKTPFRLQWGIKNKPIETIDDLKFMNSEEARHYFPSRKSKYIFYGSIGLCILLLLLGLIYYEEIANYFYSFNSYSSSDLYLDYLIIKNRFDMFIIEADYYIHSFLRDVRYIFEDFLGEYDLD